jgi:chloramphenicol 3-O phosphotransferase
MNKGNIIWLNGVSSSGKTTLSRMLQQKFDEPYFWLSHDTFHDMNPRKLFDIDFLEFEYQSAISLAHTAKVFSDLGRNVIADSVFVEEATVQKPETIKETISLLCDYPVLFVHVVCNKEELALREIRRGDRHLGQALAQLNDLIPKDEYDFTVNTSLNSIEECADLIIQQVAINSKQSFKRLYQLYNNA